jgi:hypothetical protein
MPFQDTFKCVRLNHNIHNLGYLSSYFFLDFRFI